MYIFYSNFRMHTKVVNNIAKGPPFRVIFGTIQVPIANNCTQFMLSHCTPAYVSSVGVYRRWWGIVQLYMINIYIPNWWEM